MKRNTVAVTMIFFLLFSGAVFAENAKAGDSEARYVLTKLTPQDGYILDSDIFAAAGQVKINNRGQVVWFWTDEKVFIAGPDGKLRSDDNDHKLFLWENGQTTVLDKLTTKDWTLALRDFNDSGQIVGYVFRGSKAFTEKALLQEKSGWPKHSKWYQPVIWDTEGNVHYIGEKYKSIVWQTPFLRRERGRDGLVNVLRFSPEHKMFYPFRSAAINNQGLVVSEGFFPERRSSRGWLFGERGVFVFSWDSPAAKRHIDFTSLIRQIPSGVRLRNNPLVSAINNHGNAVGQFHGGFIWWKEENRVERINLLENSSSPMSSTGPGYFCLPIDINDENQVVGNDTLRFYEIEGVKREDRGFLVRRAWMWQDGRTSQLPVLSPSDFLEKSYYHFLVKKYKKLKEAGLKIVSTHVLAVNNLGQAVGDALLEWKDRDKNREVIVARTPVVWKDGEVKDLNSLVSPDTPLLFTAYDINDYGQIVVSGKIGVGLLTPVSLLEGKSVAELEFSGKIETETDKEESVVLKSN